MVVKKVWYVKRISLKRNRHVIYNMKINQKYQLNTKNKSFVKIFKIFLKKALKLFAFFLNFDYIVNIN